MVLTIDPISCPITWYVVYATIATAAKINAYSVIVCAAEPLRSTLCIRSLPQIIARIVVFIVVVPSVR
jgi:hypothetical protein